MFETEQAEVARRLSVSLSLSFSVSVSVSSLVFLFYSFVRFLSLAPKKVACMCAIAETASLLPRPRWRRSPTSSARMTPWRDTWSWRAAKGVVRIENESRPSVLVVLAMVGASIL